MFYLNFNGRPKKDFCVKLAVATRLYLLDKLSAQPELVRNYGTKPKPAKLSDFDIQHKTPVVRKQFRIPVAFYGGRHTVTMLPGGGIGPECMCHVEKIFKPTIMAPHRSVSKMVYELAGANNHEAKLAFLLQLAY